MKTKAKPLLTSAEVEHVAKLANLTLKEEEKSKFQTQLSKIIGYVDQLKKVNTKNVEATSWAANIRNVLREDVITPSLSQEEVLASAKDTRNGYFKVKAIFEE